MITKETVTESWEFLVKQAEYYVIEIKERTQNINITSLEEWTKPVSNYVTDKTSVLLTDYGSYMRDWRYYIAVIFFIIYFYKQLYRKKQNIESLRPENIRKTKEPSIFDIAKTGYIDLHTEYIKDTVDSTGFDVNFIPSGMNLSLFMCGCISGQEDLVSYLLRKGGDIMMETSDGDSPLYLATFGVLNSENPNPKTIKHLLIAGSDVNGQNKKGFTPLHRAASKGNLDIIQCLLHYGADPNICNKAGIYPLDSAVNAGHVEAAELLSINVDNPHVWDVVEPHTPTYITLGLKSPQRKLLMESTKPTHHGTRKVFT